MSNSGGIKQYSLHEALSLLASVTTSQVGAPGLFLSVSFTSPLVVMLSFLFLEKTPAPAASSSYVHKAPSAMTPAVCPPWDPSPPFTIPSAHQCALFMQTPLINAQARCCSLCLENSLRDLSLIFLIFQISSETSASQGDQALGVHRVPVNMSHTP